MSSDTINLYVLRHGLTKYNAEGRFCGWVDADLSEEGASELRALSASHPFPRVEQVFSSPLRRCVQTAQIAFEGALINLVNDLKEIDFGKYELTRAPETLALPGVYERWMEHDDTLYFEGGDSIGSCRERGVRGFREALERAAKDGCESVGIVSHGMVLSLIFEALLDKPLSSEDAMVPNGMGYAFTMRRADALSERPMHYVGHLPVGAPRPDTAQSPYLKGVGRD